MNGTLSRPKPIAAAALMVMIALALLLAGCDRSGSPSQPSAAGGATFEVVAAENFWGNIAAQLAGDRASVSSIIVNPNTDPHSYEPTARDARAIANAKMVIVNGIGYDNWAPRLLQASPLSARVTLNVGSLLGARTGENPHQWYSPTHVLAVVHQIVADYDTLAPRDAVYFASKPAASRVTTSSAVRSGLATRACRLATARASSARLGKTSA